MNAGDEALRLGVAIGDRDELWRLLRALPPERQVPEAFEAVWPPVFRGIPAAQVADTDAVVRGMFQMIVNHLESPKAVAAFAPLRLLVLLRGGLEDFDSFVTTLGAADDPLAPHLMLIRPGVFVTLADRLTRAFTCAEVWPGLGDISTCRSEWVDTPLGNQPQDEKRFQLAMSLAMLSALVVFYHELAHIIRGHNAWAAARLGAGWLRENQPLPSSSSAGVDVDRRAMEADADVYAGVFLAEALKAGMLGAVNEETLPEWCEEIAFLATVTFNVFEAHARRADYRAGYHLPAIRTECFLEGVARAWGAGADRFFPGFNAAIEFCARHYQGFGDENELNGEMEALQHETWPWLTNLREEFIRFVPGDWFGRNKAHG